MGQVILFCQCAYAKLIPDETLCSVQNQLDASHVAFQRVEDLCFLAAKKHPELRQFVESREKKIILACYPRAVAALLNHAGISSTACNDIEMINLRTLPADKVAEVFNIYHSEEAVDSNGEIAQKKELPKENDWLPWFPVIDYSRCIQCMQCLSFCLFGVYGVDSENKLEVQNPEQCKPNCPACSRVCPESAIIFPKYAYSPINGDQVQSIDIQEKVKVDMSTLLSGDFYQTLRDRSQRSQSRFSPERNPDLALEERRKCMGQLAALGDIPAEVIKSLPSPEELQRRAKEAAAKAQAALKLPEKQSPPAS